MIQQKKEFCKRCKNTSKKCLSIQPFCNPVCYIAVYTTKYIFSLFYGDLEY